MGLGHIWGPEGVIRLGRPHPRVQLDVYGTPDKGLKNDFPCGGSVEWEGSLKRYKVTSQEMARKENKEKSKERKRKIEDEKALIIEGR